jgi:hypothetical protein
MSGARVLLATLSVRTSARGTAYLSGWLGRARVVGFAGERDKWGNPTWNIFVAEPEQSAAPAVRTIAGEYEAVIEREGCVQVTTLPARR